MRLPRFHLSLWQTRLGFPRAISDDQMKALLLCLCLCWANVAEASCRLALALALDVSGSVDQEEYRTQMNGLADALSDKDVREALFSNPGAPVALAVYEWSSSSYQRLVQDWVTITDQAILSALVARLRSWQRAPAPEATGLGAAMEYGNALIRRNPGCWHGVLDISGDGKNNDWPTPRDLKAKGNLAGIGINALVVTKTGQTIMPPESGELVVYFQALVIQGPNAFVEVAQGFEDYARAMRRKLLKELATQPVGRLRPAKP